MYMVSCKLTTPITTNVKARVERIIVDWDDRDSVRIFARKSNSILRRGGIVETRRAFLSELRSTTTKKS